MSVPTEDGPFSLELLKELRLTMLFYLSVCISLCYLFWSHSPLAYEVLMDGEKEKGNGGLRSSGL